jgi:outer membrane biosynthesis protein TonB
LKNRRKTFLASILLDKSGRTFNFSPSALEIREEKIVMKTLKQFLFAITMVIGISMTASAQKDGDKKTPPKEGKPPVIVVEPKKTKPEEKPKPEERRKKPEMFIFRFADE